MRPFFPSLIAALAAAALPATAQTAVALAPGMIFYGPDGSAAGTIREVSGTAVVVHTGTNLLTLGAESFVAGRNGPAIGYTRAQLDAVAEAANRAREERLAALLGPGAELRSNDGVRVGLVQAISADGGVIVADGKRVFRLERSQLSADAGGLILLFSADQIKAALEAAGG